MKVCMTSTFSLVQGVKQMKMPWTTNELTLWHNMTVYTLQDKSVILRTEIIWSLLCTDGRIAFSLKK